MKQKAKSGYKLVEGRFGKFEEIPDTWDESVKQGDVCKFINGYAYSKSEFRKSGYPIIRIQNLRGGKNYLYSDIPLPEKQFAEAGDLLFAWSATFGPFIWDGPKAAYHYHQWKIIPKENTDGKFLYYHFSRITPKIKQMSQSGLGMFHMTKDSMEKLQVHFPPKPEQEKIASILSEVDDLIKNTNHILEQTKLMKKGLLEKIISQGTILSKSKLVKLNPKFLKLKISENWKLVTLKDITVDHNSGIFKNKNLFGTGDNIVGVSDLYDNYLINGQIFNRVELTDKEKENHVLEEGNLLYGESSLVPSGIGKSLYVTKKGAGTVFAWHTRRIRLIETINPKLVFYMLDLPIIRNSLISRSTQTALTGITTKEYFNTVIPYPKDPNEAERAVEIFSIMDSKINIIKLKKSNLEILKKELMQKLLTGEIRVKV